MAPASIGTSSSCAKAFWLNGKLFAIVIGDARPAHQNLRNKVSLCQLFLLNHLANFTHPALADALKNPVKGDALMAATVNGDIERNRPAVGV
jgi:hypothetical protein